MAKTTRLHRVDRGSIPLWTTYNITEQDYLFVEDIGLDTIRCSFNSEQVCGSNNNP